MTHTISLENKEYWLKRKRSALLTTLHLPIKLVPPSNVVTQEEQTHLWKIFLCPNLVRSKIQSTTKNQWTNFTENQ